MQTGKKPSGFVVGELICLEKIERALRAESRDLREQADPIGAGKFEEYLRMAHEIILRPQWQEVLMFFVHICMLCVGRVECLGEIRVRCV